MLSFGSKNMTIAHECVHFFLNRKAFLFAQLMNKEIKSIQCEAKGVVSNSSSLIFSIMVRFHSLVFPSMKYYHDLMNYSNIIVLELMVIS